MAPKRAARAGKESGTKRRTSARAAAARKVVEKTVSAETAPRARARSAPVLSQAIVEDWDSDGRDRCARWFSKGAPKENMLHYHDCEWGRPSHDDVFLFEMLALSGAQAGLNWNTIFNRREGYNRAYASFDAARVAQFTDADIEALLKDEGIIRNRTKVASVVHNAKRIVEVQREFGSFAAYLWSFVDGRPVVNHRKPDDPLAATSELSDRVAAALKKRGFKFCGSTIMHAYLQTVGLIHDHDVTCFVYKEVVNE